MCFDYSLTSINSHSLAQRISIAEDVEGEECTVTIKESMQTVTQSMDQRSRPSDAPETIMDLIIRREREEYVRLINDSTRIHREDSPEPSNVDSNSGSDAQAGPDTADTQACYTEDPYFIALVAEQLSLRSGGRRARMVEQMALRRSRRAEHLLALGRLGFPLAGYIIASDETS